MSSSSPNECWLIDLDGVLWLANEPIKGSAGAIEALRASGRRVAFYTNNSFLTRAALLDKFKAQGYEDLDEDLLFSSAQTAAELCRDGERAYVVGGAGIREALSRRGVEVLDAPGQGHDRADVVVVGLDPSFDYAKLTAAMTAVANGARLIGTNDDPTYPTPSGPVPGGGSMLSAIAYACSVTPVVAGKPHPASVELLAKHLGEVAVAVGDRPSTDGLLAERLGAKFALVRSGVTPPGALVEDPVPDIDEADLATVVERLLS